MAKINLLPWRDELREKRKKEFIAICIGAFFLGVIAAAAVWFYYDQKLQDQGMHVEKGIFGADMKIELLNDGPVTIVLDSKELF